MRLGSHVSTAGKLFLSLERAHSIGCQSMQIFVGNPRSWEPARLDEKDIDEFIKRKKKYDIRPIAIHLPYLVNLCSPKEDLREKSINAVLTSLERAREIEAEYVVTHFGSHLGAGRPRGIEELKASLTKILAGSFGNSKLLLENTSGAGHTLGFHLGDFEELFDHFKDDDRLGLCLDTAHAYAAGYNISDEQGALSLLDNIDGSFGLERLGLMHLNDSKSDLNSKKDRHENIGDGKIGNAGFRKIINDSRLKETGGVLETPKVDLDDDRINLMRLKALRNS